MATITKGKTFASGEVVTPQKMHDMVDLATVAGIVNADIDAGAAIAAAKLASTLDLSGKTVTLPAASVTAAMLANTLDLSSKTLTLPRPLTLATAKSSTSGTDVEFTGIPSWANKVTLMFHEVSTNGTDPMSVQIAGSGGYSGTYMTGGSRLITTAVATTTNNNGFSFNGPSNVNASMSGNVSLTRVTGNTWAASGIISGGQGQIFVCVMAGSKALSEALDRIRVTTTGGANTFDAGTINIMYEG
jgi:hypothetical protein